MCCVRCVAAVSVLREFRCRLVQNPDQYVFTHQVIIDAAAQSVCLALIPCIDINGDCKLSHLIVWLAARGESIKGCCIAWRSQSVQRSRTRRTAARVHIHPARTSIPPVPCPAPHPSSSDLQTTAQACMAVTAARSTAVTPAHRSEASHHESGTGIAQQRSAHQQPCMACRRRSCLD